MGDTPVRCRIPELLRNLRRTQNWLAEQTGYSRQRIYDYIAMRGDKVMSLKTAKRIANCLGCKIDDLYDWE
jgi:DNA-binding XRE family transcriptional regulator